MPVKLKPSSDHLILCFFPKNVYGSKMKWIKKMHWSKISIKECEVKYHKGEMQDFWNAWNL